MESNKHEVSAKLIKGNRKHDLLEIQGYLFERNKIIVGGTSYRCLKYSSCGARAHRLENGTFQIGEHTHPPDSISVKARVVMSKGKELAESNRCLQTTQILQVMEEFCEEVDCPISALGSGPNIKRKITEARVKAHGKFSLGENLFDLQIPPPLQVTTKNNRFLLHDSGAGPNRIIIFAAAEDLDRLSYCNTWLIDGTFKSCPPMFSQVYTIHGVYQGVTAIPFVYAFLPGKRKETYLEFFDVVSRNTIGEPGCIISDFEIAAIQACRETFVGTEMRGCLFHLTQSIFRRVQANADVYQRYKSDDSDGRKVRAKIRSLGALAFLPPIEVMNGYLELRNQFIATDPVREIFRYFLDTYIGNSWDDVLFPIEFWSVSERFRERIPRTNNGKEGWHFRFNSLAPRPHPNVQTCIEMIRSEQRHASMEAERIRTGVFPGRKKKSIRIDKQLRNIMANRDNQLYSDYIEFLDAIQSCLHNFLHH